MQMQLYIWNILQLTVVLFVAAIIYATLQDFSSTFCWLENEPQTHSSFTQHTCSALQMTWTPKPKQ